MAPRVVWPGMALDLAAWCRDCQLCARGKASPQHTAPVQPIPIPEWHFTHMHVDLVGPLPTSAEGFKYLFTMVDRSSRWLEATPLQTMAAEDCVDARVSSCQPSSLQTRAASSPPLCGPHQAAGDQARADHRLPPAVPWDDGEDAWAAEGRLRARLAGSRWPEHLTWVLLGLRTAPKEDSGV